MKKIFTVIKARDIISHISQCVHFFLLCSPTILKNRDITSDIIPKRNAQIITRIDPSSDDGARGVNNITIGLKNAKVDIMPIFTAQESQLFFEIIAVDFLLFPFSCSSFLNLWLDLSGPVPNPDNYIGRFPTFCIFLIFYYPPYRHQ